MSATNTFLGIEVTIETFPTKFLPQHPNYKHSLALDIYKQSDTEVNMLRSWVHRVCRKFPQTSDEQKFAVLSFLETRNVQFYADASGNANIRDLYGKKYEPLVTGKYEVGVIPNEGGPLNPGQIESYILYIHTPKTQQFRLVHLDVISINNFDNYVNLDKLSAKVKSEINQRLSY